jgi:hypothetical protein
VKPGANASQFAAVWFGNDYDKRRLDKIVEEAVRDLDWDSLAVDLRW